LEKSCFPPLSEIANAIILTHSLPMLVLPTAKVLLYIALQLGPAHPTQIYATSNSESYVWTYDDSAKKPSWSVVAYGFPSSDCTRDPSKTVTFAGSEPPVDNDVPGYIRSISRFDWSRNGAIVFDNGDRIEKHGDHAYLILNAGGANEKTFTILFPQDGDNAPRYCRTISSPPPAFVQ
jgi:hypothetical protein